MKNKYHPQLLWWMLRALIANGYIEWKYRRLEMTRRNWRALKVGGGGVVPLGKVNQEKAIIKTAKFGTVSFVDPEVAVVFYSDVFKQ